MGYVLLLQETCCGESRPQVAKDVCALLVGHIESDGIDASGWYPQPAVPGIRGRGSM
jgi:hypothetical protein